MTSINETLFPDCLPLLSEDSADDRATFELLKKQYPKPEYDPYYLASACIKSRREAFEKLWQDFKPYADTNFLDEAKRHFHQRSWEMYVCHILLHRCNIKPCDITSDNEGPDFIVDNQLYLECVACERGNENNENSVPLNIPVNKVEAVPHIPDNEEKPDKEVKPVPQDKIFLRVASVFKEKADKYKTWIKKGTIPDDKPYVITINIGEFDYPEPWHSPWVMRTLLGIDGINVCLNTGESEFSWLPEVKKENGSTVPIAQFRSPEYEHVSGVLFSRRNVLDHLCYRPDEYFFLNNPFAKNPVSASFAAHFDKMANKS